MAFVLIGSVCATDIDANDAETISQSNDAIVSEKTLTDVLSTNASTYSELSEEIGSGGEIELKYEYYTYDQGSTICITTDNSVINGNGAIIDMAGSVIQPLNVNASKVTIKDLTIKNANFGGSGGAIFFGGSGSVENCSFINNTAGNGIVYSDYYFNASNCNFVNNAAGTGGAICTYLGMVENCNFTNNGAAVAGAIYIACDGIVENCSFVNNYAEVYGGAIVVTKECTLGNCNFVNNSAEVCGGAVYFNENGEVTNCNFTNNRVFEYGGALAIMNLGVLENCNFVNNSACNYGGAVIINDDGIIKNCNFANNTVDEYGGALFISNNGELTKCNFENNAAGTNGGAIDLGSYSILEDCIFVNNNAGGYGGALTIYENAELTNCIFVNNTAGDSGGAAFIYDAEVIVDNCSFVNGRSANYAGGIVFFKGALRNCNFCDNNASYGGAVFIYDRGVVDNCNFIGNNATIGSAIYFKNDTGLMTISNSLLLNNRADADANSSLQVVQNGNKIEITFMGQNNLLNAICSKGNVSVVNITYWGAKGIANTGGSLTSPSKSNREAGQNITVVMVVNDIFVLNTTKVTDENGTVFVDAVAGNSKITARHDEDLYYTQAETKEEFNITGNESSLELSAAGRTVNATVNPDAATGNVIFIVENESGIVKAVETALNNGVSELDLNDLIGGKYVIGAAYEGNIGYCPSINNISIVIMGDVPINAGDVSIAYGEVAEIVVGVSEYINGQNVTISVNGTLKNATVDRGMAKANFTDLGAGEYVITADYWGDEFNFANSTVAKLTVSRLKTSLSAKDVTVTYNANKNLVITLKDAKGNAIGGAEVTVSLKSAKTYSTDKNGQIKVSTKGLAPYKYPAIITFKGDDNYVNSTKSVRVTVKKATPKMTAKAKTFKKSDKTKKYTVTLKTNKNKVMKNAKVTLKVNGKTYSAKTNARGQATFKITNLAKKGKYLAVVKYAGSKYYNAKTVEPKIIVK